jgi:hypothetical protein
MFVIGGGHVGRTFSSSMASVPYSTAPTMRGETCLVQVLKLSISFDLLTAIHSFVLLAATQMPR